MMKDINPNHLHIFVNTWDEDYKKWVTDTYAGKYNIHVFDSKLKGSPGQGKNLVLDWFLKSDYDYLVPVDGDDFLWPGSIGKIQKIIERYPADFYHYRYTDMVVTHPNHEKGKIYLADTKDWYKTTYEIHERLDRPDKNEHETKLVRYIFDVDRIAVETKISARVKYEERTYSTEDVHRNLRLKMLSMTGEMTGISIDSRDLYCYIKTYQHRLVKRRPRQLKPIPPELYEEHGLPRFNIIEGQDWHLNEANRRTRDLLLTLNWGEEEERLLSQSLPTVIVVDKLAFDYKKKLYNQDNFEPIGGEDYYDLLADNMFRDFDPRKGHNLDDFRK